MPDILDNRYLEFVQYKDASLLRARIQLHQRFSTNKYGWFMWIFDKLNISSTAKILELGCGPGTLWVENINRVVKGWSITLSDFSTGMLLETRSNLRVYPCPFVFVACNAMDIPFQDESFDAVIANHMLYHISDLRRGFGEIARVLKPGGRLFATTNGESHIQELSEIMDSQIHIENKHYSPTFSAGSFTLENGWQQLSPWFKEIEIRRYEDELVVTEATPLVAYILSMIPQADIPPGSSLVEDLQTNVNQLIISQGSIKIQKSIGMFIGELRGRRDE